MTSLMRWARQVSLVVKHDALVWLMQGTTRLRVGERHQDCDVHLGHPKPHGAHSHRPLQITCQSN